VTGGTWQVARSRNQLCHFVQIICYLVVLTFELAPERHHPTLRWSLRGQRQNVNTALSLATYFLSIVAWSKEFNLCL
jgi:hypothetical protein